MLGISQLLMLKVPVRLIKTTDLTVTHNANVTDANSSQETYDDSRDLRIGDLRLNQIWNQIGR